MPLLLHALGLAAVCGLLGLAACAHGQAAAESVGSGAPCVDDGHWRDSKFGDGTSDCEGIEAHADRAMLCRDHGDWSAEARRACPCACSVHVQVPDPAGGGQQQLQCERPTFDTLIARESFFARQLRAEDARDLDVPSTEPRQVQGATIVLHSLPTPFKSPSLRLVAVDNAVARLLGVPPEMLRDTERMSEYFSGRRRFPGAVYYAHCYGASQSTPHTNARQHCVLEI